METTGWRHRPGGLPERRVDASIWTRIKDFGLWSRAQKERDLEREIRNHVDLEAEESGLYGAQRAFGNAMLVKEDVRAAWGCILLAVAALACFVLRCRASRIDPMIALQHE